MGVLLSFVDIAAAVGRVDEIQALEGAQPPLGNTYENTSRDKRSRPALGQRKPSDKKDLLVRAGRARFERWLMLSAARDLIPWHRSATCNRIVLTDKTTIKGVPVKYAADTNRARYDNLNACANVWCCPICSIRIAVKREKLLADLIKKHFSAGGRLIHIVLTVKHNHNSNLENLLAKTATARQKMHRSREYRELIKKYGYVGTVHTKEVTYSDRNGWHPHVHELMFTDDSWFMSHFPRFKNAYLTMWLRYAKLAGLESVTDALTFDIASDDLESAQRMAHYLTVEASEHVESDSDMTEIVLQNIKLQNAAKNKTSSASKEITFGVMKHERITSKETDGEVFRTIIESETPFTLLKNYAVDGCTRSGALFAEYAAAFNGKRQVIFSDGLKKRYGVKDKKDAELIATPDDEEKTLWVLNRQEWAAIVGAHPKVRGEVLRLVEMSNGDTALALDYVEKVLIHYLSNKI